MQLKACFNTQPPEGGWQFPRNQIQAMDSFNTQPPEGGWLFETYGFVRWGEFQHTAARRRLVGLLFALALFSSFNTQPPEGGWWRASVKAGRPCCFNTQPPEGGWGCRQPVTHYSIVVSTHSRPKAAGAW